MHCLRHVGNDDLHFVCNGEHGAHQGSINFVKGKCAKQTAISNSLKTL